MNILYDRSNQQKLELENMVKMKFIYNVVIRNWKPGIVESYLTLWNIR